MKTFLLCSICIAVCTVGGHGRQVVRGSIEGDVRWNADEGPYVVENDILVTRRARLLIAPGTRIIIAPKPIGRYPFEQADKIDSSTISIRIEGALNCAGRQDRRIVFSPDTGYLRNPCWFGIILDGISEQFTEITGTDIAGAIKGISVRNCNPLIHNCIFEFNGTGIDLQENGSARVNNCILAHNLTTGIRIRESNPLITNCIIVYNRNTGIWCDGISRVHLEYNCLFGNHDGDLMDCDPEAGHISRRNTNGDSTDTYHNLFTDPIFAGSASDSIAAERDLKLPTDKSRIIDTMVARVVHTSLRDSIASIRKQKVYPRYSLSPYSPCINAGNPSAEYKDTDNSKNDMGIYGGPDFIDTKNR